MEKLTELELIALKSITHADFYENGRDSIPWEFAVMDACPLKGKTRSGAFGSLAKKGYIFCQPKEKMWIVQEDGTKIKNKYYSPNDDGTIKITPEGYRILDEMGLIDEDGHFI